MLAARLIGAPLFRIQGAAWPLIYTHAALMRIEDLTGLNVLNGGLDLSRPSLRILRAALFAGLEAGGAPVTIEAAGAEITPAKFNAVHSAVVSGWLASMPEPEEGGGDSDGDGPLKTWLSAWATAWHDLRLSDEAWQAMTPRQIQALQYARLESLRHSEIQTGIIASNIECFSMSRPPKPRAPADFMLHPWPEKPQTIEELLRITNHLKAEDLNV